MSDIPDPFSRVKSWRGCVSACSKTEKLFKDENLKSGERQQQNFYEKFQNDFAQSQKFITDHS